MAFPIQPISPVAATSAPYPVLPVTSPSTELFPLYPSLPSNGAGQPAARQQTGAGFDFGTASSAQTTFLTQLFGQSDGLSAELFGTAAAETIPLFPDTATSLFPEPTTSLFPDVNAGSDSVYQYDNLYDQAQEAAAAYGRSLSLLQTAATASSLFTAPFVPPPTETDEIAQAEGTALLTPPYLAEPQPKPTILTPNPSGIRSLFTSPFLPQASGQQYDFTV